MEVILYRDLSNLDVHGQAGLAEGRVGGKRHDDIVFFRNPAIGACPIPAGLDGQENRFAAARGHVAASAGGRMEHRQSHFDDFLLHALYSEERSRSQCRTLIEEFQVSLLGYFLQGLVGIDDSKGNPPTAPIDVVLGHLGHCGVQGFPILSGCW